MASSNFDHDHLIRWYAKNPSEWYNNLALTEYTLQCDDDGVRKTSPTFSAAIRGICEFPHIRSTNGIVIELIHQHDIFEQKKDREALAEKDILYRLKGERVRSDGDADDQVSTSSSNRSDSGARCCDLALRIRNMDRRIIVPALVMQVKKGGDVAKLVRRGFHQAVWYLINAFRTHGCTLGCVIANTRLQRLVVVEDGIIVVETTDAHRRAQTQAISIVDFASIFPFNITSLPLEFPQPILDGNTYRLPYVKGTRTAVEGFHLLYVAAVKRCLQWIENDVQTRGQSAEVDHDVCGTEGDSCFRTESRLRKQRGREAEGDLEEPMLSSEGSSGTGGGAVGGGKGGSGKADHNQPRSSRSHGEGQLRRSRSPDRSNGADRSPADSGQTGDKHVVSSDHDKDIDGYQLAEPHVGLTDSASHAAPQPAPATIPTIQTGPLPPPPDTPIEDSDMDDLKRDIWPRCRASPPAFGSES